MGLTEFEHFLEGSLESFVRRIVGPKREHAARMEFFNQATETVRLVEIAMLFVEEITR